MEQPVITGRKISNCLRINLGDRGIFILISFLRDLILVVFPGLETIKHPSANEVGSDFGVVAGWETEALGVRNLPFGPRLLF